MQSNTAYLLRKQDRAILDDKEDQYVADIEQPQVDLTVSICVVVADENGKLLIPGKPKVRVVNERHLGGIYDLKERTFIGRSATPRIWYASEDQDRIIFARVPAARLVEGSEGAGKTTLLAMWHFVQWIRHIGQNREGLQTAPTSLRLGHVRREIKKLWRPEWYRYVNRKDFVGHELCDGSAIRMVSTHKASDADGSPIQGFNSSWAGRDETQDQTAAHEDIESRGRDARDGVYPQLGTATVKPNTDYRMLKSLMRDGGEWEIEKLLVCRSLDGTTRNIEMRTPFITKRFVESKRANMPEREFRRRFFAEDPPLERAIYTAWERDAEGRWLNCIPLPPNARKITSIVLRGKLGEPRFHLLIGNDPGLSKSASIFLDAFQLPRHEDPVWFVRSELFTRRTSIERHARLVKERAQKQFGVNIPGRVEVAHVRSQPVGQSADKPDQDVYRIFEREGLHAKAAQYTDDGKGTGHIDVEMRVEMVNRLLCNADGVRRLFIEMVDGKPVAPLLVKAFETMERDERGRIPRLPKDDSDPSDPPDALGYGLWSFEKELAKNMRATTRNYLSGSLVA